MKKVFCYYRVSGLGQVDKSGFDRQETIVRKYCSDNNFEIVKEYYDVITGKSDYRPAFEEMIKDINSEVSYCIIERIDRLSRETFTGLYLQKLLNDKNVEIISATEGPLNSNSDPTSKLMTDIILSVASYERSRIVEKLKISREKIRATGQKCEGSKSYSNLDVLCVMQDMRSEGSTLQAICDYLNKNRIPTKRGKSVWRPGSVASVLQVAHNR